MGTAITHGETSEGFGGPTAPTLHKLIKQLQDWRDWLPPPLQWPENDPTVYPNEVHDHFRAERNLDPSLGPLPKLFTAEPQLDQCPVFSYVYDIQVALLRTRYYYAKYMVYRPYVYKALHFPDELTQDDMEAVAACLKVCCAVLKPFLLNQRHCFRERRFLYSKKSTKLQKKSVN